MMGGALNRGVQGMDHRPLLLVEDNPGHARLLREMFLETGTRSTELACVETLFGAEKLLADREVDIILLDLGLPDSQGLGAVRRVRAIAPRTPLVVLSGRDDETLALQALQEGAQDYLVKGRIETRVLAAGTQFIQKPFDATSLLRKVRETLDETASLPS